MEGAIVGLSGSILVVMFGGFSALWYRLGRLKGRMTGIEGGLNHLEGKMPRLAEMMTGIEGGLNHIRSVLKK